MSGWFVQRGEIAAVDPWIRASMAVHAGVDLVVLLPAWFSLRSADYFAAGAVKTLAATGIVDTLACGAEHTGTASSSLSSTAAWSLLPETEQQIKTLLQQGLSYGAAWETAASRSQKDAGWFKGANNLLALAYQKALLHNHLAIELITLPRQGSGYNDTELRPPYASASAIRTALRNGVSATELAPFLPDTSLALLCRILPSLCYSAGKSTTPPASPDRKIFCLSCCLIGSPDRTATTCMNTAVPVKIYAAVSTTQDSDYNEASRHSARQLPISGTLFLQYGVLPCNYCCNAPAPFGLSHRNPLIFGYWLSTSGDAVC